MRRLLLYLLLGFMLPASAQFKNDNIKYTNVFPEELCKILRAHPGWVLLDVRSQGEFDDTLSSSPGLNIGRIKDAIHISVQELPVRWKELSAYKDKPLFIYCSHSQRSRRASRMLADSGFTRLFNIDGGLTNFYVQGLIRQPCSEFSIITSVPYKIISPEQMVQQAKTGASWHIIDLRNDSAFNGTSLSEKVKSEGRFTRSVNIPFDRFTGFLPELSPEKPILLVDEYGNDSPQAALKLIKNGFKDVSILLNGIDEWVDYSIQPSGKLPVEYTLNREFKLISAEEFNGLLETKKPVTLLDVRSKEEFTNQSKNYWENIGQIRDAINIPAASLDHSPLLPTSRKQMVIVYGFGDPLYVYEAAATLKKQGYKNIALLRGGIWYLRWASHNLRGKEKLDDRIINVPEQNL